MVIGESMEPSFKPHQLFLVDKSYYKHHPIKCGDAVVFKHEGMTYIKRIAAVSGDAVWLFEYTGDPADSEFIQPKDFKLWQKAETVSPHLGRINYVRVPEGRVFVVGDYRERSIDSRAFGPIRANEITGRVLLPCSGRS
jgi:signal peptidase I